MIDDFYGFSVKYKHWLFGLAYSWAPLYVSIWHYNERLLEVISACTAVTFYIHLWGISKADEVKELEDKINRLRKR